MLTGSQALGCFGASSGDDISERYRGWGIGMRGLHTIASGKIQLERRGIEFG